MKRINMGLKRIAVFCGSSSGNNDDYAGQARELGRHLAGKGIELVYGGGAIGLMGILADSVIHGGGRVTGVIPDFFRLKEIAHQGIHELIQVPSMHERKMRMANMADGFIALPGGFGTLDELFEIVTWAQLDLHRKPVGLLNPAGYFDHLLHFLDHVHQEGFVHDAHFKMILSEEKPAKLLQRMDEYQAPDQSKWLDLIKA